MHGTHHGSDEPLDVAAKARGCGRPVLELDAVSRQAALRARVELRAIIAVKNSGQACDRPVKIKASLIDPSAFVVNGMQQA